MIRERAAKLSKWRIDPDGEPKTQSARDEAVHGVMSDSFSPVGSTANRCRG